MATMMSMNINIHILAKKSGEKERFCPKCDKELPDTAMFCKNYGYKTIGNSANCRSYETFKAKRMDLDAEIE